MASVMAIVSKAVFEKQARGASEGTVLPLADYASTHAALAQLADGGALFLVTVRPPDERLWLIGVLEAPEGDDDGWHAAPNVVPIVDLGDVKGELAFASGKGLKAAKGALGMSLQTPRALADGDVAKLRAVCGGGGGGETAPVKAKQGSKAAAKAAKPVAAAAKAAKPAAATAAAATGADAVRAALESGSGAAALTAALAWWAETRSPAVADLVDAVSRRVSAPAVADDKAFAKLARAKDPLDLGALLPAIPNLAVSFLPTAAELLSEFPVDPRTATAVGSWALDPIATSSSAYPFWTKILDVVVRARDVRVVPMFEKRLKRAPGDSQFWPKFYAALERVNAKLKAEKPGDVAPAAALAKLVAKLSPIAAGGTAPVASDPAPKLDGPLLAQALAHLVAGRTVAAIDAMLARWRETRVAELADLVDRATRLLPAYDLPLPVVDKDLETPWLAAFERDAMAAMPQLLQNINLGGAKLAERRLVELGNLPDDPRIAVRLAELTTAWGVSAERTQYWKSLLQQIARIADVRTCEPLRIAFRDFTNTYFDHHRQAKRIIAPFVTAKRDTVVLPAADRELVAKLAAAITAAADRSAEPALVRAIADEWDDDAPRRIYADWLMDRGHPRGELIALACKADRTPAEEERPARAARHAVRLRRAPRSRRHRRPRVHARDPAPARRPLGRGHVELARGRGASARRARRDDRGHRGPAATDRGRPRRAARRREPAARDRKYRAGRGARAVGRGRSRAAGISPRWRKSRPCRIARAAQVPSGSPRSLRSERHAVAVARIKATAELASSHV